MYFECIGSLHTNFIGDVMVSVLDSSMMDRGLVKQDYKVGICYFSAKHAAVWSKSRDWLAQNLDNVSEWGGMSTHGLLFQRVSTIKMQRSLLIQYKADIITIS